MFSGDLAVRLAGFGCLNGQHCHMVSFLRDVANTFGMAGMYQSLGIFPLQWRLDTLQMRFYDLDGMLLVLPYSAEAYSTL